MEEVNNQIMQNVLTREENIYGSDATSHFTVPIKLDGNNYPIWKKHFEMVVSWRSKLPFLLGEGPKPDIITNPKEYRKWKAYTDMVHSWLLSSITTDLQPSFLTANDPWTLWAELNTKYNQENVAMLYDVLVQTYILYQGQDSVCTYSQNSPSCGTLMIQTKKTTILQMNLKDL